MTPRDLLQRRATLLNGDTVWLPSALVQAARSGRLAVLDGADQLPSGTFASLQRLLMDRDLSLPDGTRLLRADRYDELVKRTQKTQGGLSHEEAVAQLDKLKIHKVHKAFRVVALARPSAAGKTQAPWLTAEIQSMFHFHVMRPLSTGEELGVLRSMAPGVDEGVLASLVKFAKRLRSGTDDIVMSLATSLSTRQLIRICRRLSVFTHETLHENIDRACLSRFLPKLAQSTLLQLLHESKIHAQTELELLHEEAKLTIEASPTQLRIGDVVQPLQAPKNPLLVPQIVFHNNPRQTRMLREMLKDYQLGDNLLLIGNQGVGKNKLADRLLELMRLPREYIQLHRDTTVQSLTSAPTVKDGLLVYEDSPLVRAAREGYVLVVDEADKANPRNE